MSEPKTDAHDPYVSNEDLLREGERPRPNCIEPSGHTGVHSDEPETEHANDCGAGLREALQRIRAAFEQRREFPTCLLQHSDVEKLIEIIDAALAAHEWQRRQTALAKEIMAWAERSS